jgi:hypothetical protein
LDCSFSRISLSLSSARCFCFASFSRASFSFTRSRSEELRVRRLSSLDGLLELVTVVFEDFEDFDDFKDSFDGDLRWENMEVVAFSLRFGLLKTSSDELCACIFGRIGLSASASSFTWALAALDPMIFSFAARSAE